VSDDYWRRNDLAGSRDAVQVGPSAGREDPRGTYPGATGPVTSRQLEFERYSDVRGQRDDPAFRQNNSLDYVNPQRTQPSYPTQVAAQYASPSPENYLGSAPQSGGNTYLQDVIAAQNSVIKQLRDEISNTASSTTTNPSPSTNSSSAPPAPVTSSVPPETRNTAKEEGVKPWGPLVLTTFALFTSLGANAYLAWLAWSFYWRFRDVANDVVRARNHGLAQRQAA
jgi:hypothetical protein